MEDGKVIYSDSEDENWSIDSDALEEAALSLWECTGIDLIEKDKSIKLCCKV